MTYVPNPFRVRLAEQQRDTGQFLRTFGGGMLDTLPSAEVAWDRLIVLRSAPGAGKTSLMRMFTPAALTAVTAAPDEYDHLAAPLERTGAIRGSEPAVLGVLIGLGKDYRALVDLGPAGRGSDIVFFRLLDARIAVRHLEAVLASRGRDFPGDAGRVVLSLANGEAGQLARAALDRMVPDWDHGREEARFVGGEALLRAARAHENDVLRLLDSLLPVDWTEAHGHSRLYMLRILSGISVEVDGRAVSARPALLLDDVHDLAEQQRRALYEQLMDRTLNTGRWIAERYTAVPDDELLTDASPDGRAVAVIRIERAMAAGPGGGRSRATERVFGEIANSRARLPLSLAGHETDTFTTLLKPRDDVPAATAAAALHAVRARLDEHRRQNPRYAGWAEQAARAAKAASTEGPLRQAVLMREAQLLIERDLGKPNMSLFEDEPPERSYDDLTGSDTRAAARLFLAREHGIPYYAGPAMLADLASRNVEQYLGLAGDLFDLMLAAVRLNRPPALSAADQDRHARAASRRLWTAVPQRVPYGDDVAALLHAIAANSRHETYRPNAPYAPGVTGTAFASHERSRLLNRTGRHDDGGAVERLARALGSAVAHNLLEADHDNKTKNGSWTVLYLNRLLCPFFGLPLQRSGFREQPVRRLAQWLDGAAKARRGAAAPDPDEPLPGIGGAVG